MKKYLLIAMTTLSMLSVSSVVAQDAMLGEVKLFAGNFAPRGWAFCDGQVLSISSNTALFSILGTIYGGDGRTTFALPDLRGSIPVGVGTGQGLNAVTLGQKSRNGAPGKEAQATLGMHYIIAVQGIYPSRN